jgi:hypothetical protein
LYADRVRPDQWAGVRVSFRAVWGIHGYRFGMKDLTDARWIKLKGILFLLVGIMASVLLVIEAPSLKVTALLTVAIWCFCRCYYFAFYVIEHYVDARYKFSGLWSFALYLSRRK